jgi:hypothetical protein
MAIEDGRWVGRPRTDPRSLWSDRSGPGGGGWPLNRVALLAHLTQ